MKGRLCRGAALALLICGPCYGLFGKRQEAQANKITVLWLPAESFSDWTRLSEAFRGYDQLKVTAGLTPEMVTPAFRAQMDPWIGQGRFEPALRLPGDPVLPLISDNPQAPRPRDPIQRLALARQDFTDRFGSVPAGFVPGGGALTARLLPDIQSMGFKWAAVGDYGEDWSQTSGLPLIPLKAVRTFGQPLSPQSLSLPDYPAPCAFVIDEAGGLAPRGSFLALLGGLASSKKTKLAWSTLSEAAAARDLQAASTATWPTWLGGYGAWTDNPEQKKAWKLYADAALALERYQNSGGADLQALENAGKELYAAQAGRYFRALDRSGVLAELENIEQEFRAHLSEIYRLTRQDAPTELSASLFGAAASASSGARFKKGDGWMEFENTPARILAAGDLWTILSLRVDWDDKGLSLTYKMGRLETDVAAPRGFGRLLLDAYIDLNHVAGAGSTRLLEGRGAFTQSRDAWEYALTASGWGCSLFRFNPRGAPVKAGDCAATADLKTGTVQLKIARDIVRGNPARWGYVAVALETDAASASQEPPKPLRHANAAAILGLLEQETPAAKTAIPERLTAVRAKP